MNAPSHVGLRVAVIVCMARRCKILGQTTLRKGAAASAESIGEF